jgi:hypothetical protein
MEHGFGLWISDQLTNASFEFHGHLASPPSYIIEDHINGGISLASKDVYFIMILWPLAVSIYPAALSRALH